MRIYRYAPTDHPRGTPPRRITRARALELLPLARIRELEREADRTAGMVFHVWPEPDGCQRAVFDVFPAVWPPR